MTTAPAMPLEVAVLLHTLNRAKRSLAETTELFRTTALDLAHQTEVVARLEDELKAAREAAR